ncbi:hypothetical protein N8T08_007157 [Aspergillus melleus]|uniref:Uncharacterized protein n=1 Tax=Aspergillus melleus TaxID=138277 RepID=A0ACC3AY65_9EURO|nr:hypothetical protein N8T08_007157 [Aspergillus melleus]
MRWQHPESDQSIRSGKQSSETCPSHKIEEEPLDIVTSLSDEIAHHKYWQNAFETAVTRAKKQARIPMKKNNITSLNGFHEYLKNLLASVSVENGKASEVLE